MNGKRPPSHEYLDPVLERASRVKKAFKGDPSQRPRFIQPEIVPGDNGSIIYGGMYDLNGVPTFYDIPPSGNRWFKMPYQAISINPPRSANVSQNTYDGFRELGTFATIWPTAHCVGMAYRYNRGVPEISNQDLGPSEDAWKTAWQVSVFRGIKSDDPEVNDGQEYIFTGSNAKNGSLFQMFFMRLDDLRRRIQEGNEVVALEDKKAVWSKPPRIPYPLWDYNGKRIDGQQCLNILQSLGTGAVGGRGQDDDDEWVRNSFMWYCRLARQAQANPNLSYSVLSRFWDKQWIPPSKFLLVLSPDARIKLKGKNIGSQELQEKIEVIRQKRNFKPQFDISWGDKALEGYDLWAQHPNELYYIYAPKNIMEYVKGTENLGLWLKSQPFPSQEQVKAFDEDMKVAGDDPNKWTIYETGEEAEKTYTSITINSMTTAKQMKRVPDQKGAMGGRAAIDLVEKSWDFGKSKAPEWLHRSAWSYGGLDSGPNDEDPDHLGPSSSQLLANLVIGTYETNTAMLRYETFAKRLAQYAKNGEKDTTVYVTTSILDLSKPKDWMNGKYAWFAPKLTYQINSHSHCNVYVEIRHSFNTFERRIPTRFELQLDELFENLCYRWDLADE